MMTARTVMVETLRLSAEPTPDAIDARDLDRLLGVADAIDAAVAAWLAAIGAAPTCLYVTYATDDFEPGVRIVLRSLRAVSNVPILVFTIGDWSLTHEAADIAALRVPKIVKSSVVARPGRPDQWSSFTKLWAFALTRVGRIVHLDADCLVLDDIDALFAETDFAAAPDLFTAGTRTFNAGVFTVSPTAQMRRDLYAAVPAFAPSSRSDQLLLNAFFPNWTRLPIAFNFLRTYGLVLGPVRDQRMRVLHYVSNKPWTFRKQVMADIVLEPLDRLWTERLTDAEHNELTRDWRAKLDDFERSFHTPGGLRNEIVHAQTILANDLHRTRRRLYLAFAVTMAMSLVQTAIIVALLLR